MFTIKELKDMKETTYKKKDGTNGVSLSLENGDHFKALGEPNATTFAGAKYPNYSIKATTKDKKEIYIRLTGNQYATLIKQSVIDRTIETNTYTNEYGEFVGVSIVEKA